MSDDDKRRGLRWRRRKWRREWIAKFAEGQRIARRWIAFVDLVDWCAQSTTAASLSEEAKAREVAYQRLADSVRQGEFERDDRSKILHLDTRVTDDAASPRCRLRREQFEIAFEVAAAGWAPSLPIEVLNCCWLPRELARHWVESHGYHWSPRFEPPPKKPTARKINEFDLALGWIPVTAALEIIKAASGDLAWEQLKRAIRLGRLPARCHADGVTCDLESHWLDFLAFDNADDDLLLFDRQKAWHAKAAVPHRAEDIVLPIARCIELWPDCTWSKPGAVRPVANGARAEREFQNPDWSLGNVLSWIAFGDPALICRFEGRYNLYSYRFHKHPRSGNPKRPMLVSKPDRTLLDALQDGVLTAIRNGAEIPSSHWFGKHTSHLSDDLRFRRAEVIRCWRAEGEEAAITMAAARRVRSKPRDDKPVRRPPSREKKFWQAAREAAVEWLIENGCPAPNDGHQAELERHVTEWLEGHGYEAGESSVRRHAASWIKEYREKLKT